METLRLFNLSRWALVLVIALDFVIPHAHAQGGKAEPLRVQFQRGRSSAMIAGKLRGDEQAEYVAGAKKDQKLTIKLYAPQFRQTWNIILQAHSHHSLSTSPQRLRFPATEVLSGIINQHSNTRRHKHMASVPFTLTLKDEYQHTNAFSTPVRFDRSGCKRWNR